MKGTFWSDPSWQDPSSRLDKKQLRYEEPGNRSLALQLVVRRLSLDAGKA